jgi:hypothetical protein
MDQRRVLMPFVLASLLLAGAIVCGCRVPCDGPDQRVSPVSLDIRGQAFYRSETSADLVFDFEALLEPHKADPIYDGDRIDVSWELPGPMTFQLTLWGPIDLGTTPLTELDAQLCVCEVGLLQGPEDAPECAWNGATTPARCEALVGDVFVREISHECLEGVFEECAERVDLDIVVPETDEGRFSGAMLIRWFEAFETRTCVEGPTIG